MTMESGRAGRAFMGRERKTCIRPEVASRMIADQLEALIQPASDTPYHHFHPPSECRETDRCPVSAIAVRSGAQDNEHSVGRPLRHIASHDLAMRHVDRACNMTLPIKIRASNIQKDKVGGAFGY